MNTHDSDHWLVRKSTIRVLWVVFILILAATTLSDLFVKHKDHFGIESTFGFGSWFGFFSCVILVLFSKGVGLLLKRRDTYYDD